MKTVNFCVLFIAFNSLVSFGQPPISTLTVEVDSFQKTSGKKIIVSVFQKSNFLEMEKTKSVQSVVATGDKVGVTFRLPKGDYAVIIYHDLNSNNSLDKNFFSIPKEPYGFSKNFKPKMSAPKFSDCSFSLNDESKTISISMIP